MCENEIPSFLLNEIPREWGKLLSLRLGVLDTDTVCLLRHPALNSSALLTLTRKRFLCSNRLIVDLSKARGVLSRIRLIARILPLIREIFLDTCVDTGVEFFGLSGLVGI